MIKIVSRNIDEVKICHEFESPQAFVDDWQLEDCSMGDNEILLVIWDDRVVYSSLGRKVKGYGDTVRTCDVVDWFSNELDNHIHVKKRMPNRIETLLPDGAALIAEIFSEHETAGIRLFYKKLGGNPECVCRAEYHPSWPKGKELIIRGYLEPYI
jgi:hypothetical protein